MAANDEEGIAGPTIDLAIALAGLVLAIGIVVFATDIQAGVVRDPIGSRGIPYAIGGLLGILSLVLGVRSAMRRRRWSRHTSAERSTPTTGAMAAAAGPSTASDTGTGMSTALPARDTDTRRAWFAGGLSAVYLLLLSLIGYIAASIIVGIALVLLLEPRRWLVAVLWPVGLTLFLYVTFTNALGIRLP